MLKTYLSPPAPPRFLLIHGWCCDHQAMAPVADALGSSLSVDLLGHGSSPLGESHSIAEQAAAIAGVLDRPMIAIGHSMGGQAALELAAQRPDLIKAVILLDPARIAPTEKSQAMFEGMRAQLNARDPMEVVGAFARQQFIKASDPAGAEALLAQMLTTRPDVARAAWGAICDWPGADVLAKVQCPILLIQAAKPSNRAADLAAINKRIMPAQAAGSGHMLQFEVMDQITPMIRRFLDLNGLA